MFKQFGGKNFHKIEEYESIINMKLPNDYKQFLVNTNGGQFVNELHTFWVEELKQDIGIDALFGFDNVRDRKSVV